MSDYATSKLITALGMFIHDLWAMRYDTEGTYDETAYYNLADEIERRCRFDKGENMKLTADGDAKALTLITAIVGMCKECGYCPSFIGWEDHPGCGGREELCDLCWKTARMLAAKEE